MSASLVPLRIVIIAHIVLAAVLAPSSAAFAVLVALFGVGFFFSFLLLLLSWLFIFLSIFLRCGGVGVKERMFFELECGVNSLLSFNFLFGLYGFFWLIIPI